MDYVNKQREIQLKLIGTAGQLDEPEKEKYSIIRNCLEHFKRSHQKWVDYLKEDIEPETRKIQETLAGNTTFHKNCIQRYEVSLQVLEQLQAENKRLNAEVEYQKGLKQEAYQRSDKLEADNERLKAEMEDYIGLANVVDSFVTILPKHKLYDNIRQDVLNYLRKIKSER
ncbi:MAG: hypothetical protein ACTSYD_02880 [Candidatus Heimdallarchaeaceae archaeon]